MRLHFLIVLLIVIVQLSHSQDVVINEFCASNGIIYDSENDTPDWIELYNNSGSDINLSSYFLSDDSLDLTKWPVPEIVLSSNQVQLFFASGKDIREQVYYNTIVNQGDIFSYAIGSSQIPNDWKNVEFDDSDWDQGPSGFGYGDNDDETQVESGTLSVFVRKQFVIEDLAEIKKLLLHVDYDDGFVAYINGIEVARANLGNVNTNVPYNQTSDTYVEPLMVTGGSPQPFDIENFSSVLQAGENVLCMQVHNFSMESSDLTLIPFLTIGYETDNENYATPDVLNLKTTDLHTNFKISSDGEELYLSDATGTLIDKTDSIELPYNTSYGRFENGSGTWKYYKNGSPGLLNDSNGFDEIGENAINFSSVGGVYSQSLSLALSSDQTGDIYYTTDGSQPTLESNLYSAPITVQSSMVVKAILLNGTVLSLQATTHSYIIESRDFDLPILSLSMEPDDLWDYNTGIYVMGPSAQNEVPHFGANFWQDWEKPVYFEYFDSDGNKQYESAGGTKIFGAWSRASAQKSMSLFARKEYGNKSFKHQFFSNIPIDKFKSIVIRNSGNDWGYTAFRDGLMTGCVNNLDIDLQAFQPVVVYLNGEYWGLLNLREKVNEDFLANHHGFVDADKVDILEFGSQETELLVNEGSDEHYQKMLDYLESHDVSDNSVYDSIQKFIDVRNFMDYQITQIYLDNRDWPGNNIKFWRPQEASGKWRWILYDTDFGFGIYNNQAYLDNTLSFALESNGPLWPNPPWSTLLLRTLLENASFKNEFINRFADRINWEFKPESVNQLIDSLKNKINSEQPIHNQRWNHMWDFDYNVQVLKTFANNRPTHMRNHIKNEFSLGGLVEISVDVSNHNHGYIQLSSLKIDNNFPWSGIYFRNNPVNVSAIPKAGYKFSHWEGIESSSSSIQLNLSGYGHNLKAVFVESSENFNAIVINEINYKSSDDHDSGDWIELFNTTISDIDLGGWSIKDANNDNQFTIPSGTIINKKGYLVLYRDENKFKEIYGGLESVGPFEFGLSASTDAIRLFDTDNNLVDSVTYYNQSPWPIIDDGNETSIYLNSPYNNNLIASNWNASSNIGTPAAPNDNFVSVSPTVFNNSPEVSIYPNPFVNQTIVRWTCKQQSKIKLSLFDYKGTLIKVLEDAEFESGIYELMIGNNLNLSDGLYFVKIDSINGKSHVVKVLKQK